jgi:hypothetical protein
VEAFEALVAPTQPEMETIAGNKRSSAARRIALRDFGYTHAAFLDIPKILVVSRIAAVIMAAIVIRGHRCELLSDGITGGQ